MQKLLFFSRVALICNICFLGALLMRYAPPVANGALLSTVIISGSVLSLLINSLLLFIYLILFIIKRPFRGYIPPWLAIINFLIFVVQIIFLI